MSEEPEVSPLRLKRPGAGVPPPPAADPAQAAPALPPLVVPEAKLFEPPLVPLPGLPPLSVPPAVDHPPSEGGSGERVRRRPSLATDAGASAGSSVPHPPPDHPPAAVPPPFIPSSETPPPPAAPAFKLKIGTKPPPSSAPPPGALIGGPDPLKSFEESTGGAPLLPLPGVGPGPSGPTVPPLMPLPASVGGPALPPGTEPPGHRVPIHLKAAAPAEALDPSRLSPPPLPARAAKAAVNRSHAKRDALVFGFVFLLVVGAGAGAYFYFSRSSPPPEPAPAPGKAVADARQKEQARVDSVVDGKEPGERAVGNVSPGELQTKLQEKNSAVPAPSSTPVPPPPSGAVVPAVRVEIPEPTPAPVPSGPPPVPKASARFVRYAESIRVSGVFQGSPARALIDGRLVRQGEIVEPSLGVKFADIDVEAKQIILEDAAGAQVKVKYL